MSDEQRLTIKGEVGRTRGTLSRFREGTSTSYGGIAELADEDPSMTPPDVW